MLRSAVLGTLGVAAIIYAGIVAVACIRLGTLHDLPTLAVMVLPWFYRIYLVLLAGFSIYTVIILLMAKRNLKGTGRTLFQFMSLSLVERHEFMKALRRGPYRDV